MVGLGENLGRCFDGDPGPLDEKANESGDDCIKSDFKVDDEYSANSFGDLDEEISKLIKPKLLKAAYQDVQDVLQKQISEAEK